MMNIRKQLTSDPTSLSRRPESLRRGYFIQQGTFVKYILKIYVYATCSVSVQCVCLENVQHNQMLWECIISVGLKRDE